MANVAVSLLFAALHYTVWPTPVPIFFLSLALGLLYQRTGSLVAPMALHMTFNAVSTILMFLVMGMHPQADTRPATPRTDPRPDPPPGRPDHQPPGRRDRRGSVGSMTLKNFRDGLDACDGRRLDS